MRTVLHDLVFTDHLVFTFFLLKSSRYLYTHYEFKLLPLRTKCKVHSKFCVITQTIKCMPHFEVEFHNIIVLYQNFRNTKYNYKQKEFII